MDFAFSDEQRMLGEQVKSFVSDRLPPERVAELADGDEGWDAASWRSLGELGWIGLSAPEATGGGGMSFLDEAVVFEQLGYGLYPGPYFCSVALALPALTRDPDLARDVLAGRVAATFAYAEPDGPFYLSDLDEVGTKAESAGGGWLLTGEKDLVVDLASCEIVVVAAQAADGLGLWAVATGAQGVTSRPLESVDRTRRPGRVALDRARATLLVEPGTAGDVVAEIRLRAPAAAAAEAVGVAQKALDLATAYAKERRQFDKPIGVYQAVAHAVADSYISTELARSIAYWAAWCVAEGDASAGTAVAAAKTAAAQAAVSACERAIQVHGGIGFTWEHMLQRYYKRAQWIEAFEGSAASHRAAIAAHLLDRLPTAE